MLGDLLAIARGSGSTWEWLPAAGGTVAVTDDLAGEGGWYFVAPQLMIGSLPQAVAEVVLAQDMEAFVVRSMALDSIRARLAGSGHRRHHLPRTLGGLNTGAHEPGAPAIAGGEATVGPRPRLMQRFAPFLPVTESTPPACHWARVRRPSSTPATWAARWGAPTST